MARYGHSSQKNRYPTSPFYRIKYKLFLVSVQSEWRSICDVNAYVSSVQSQSSSPPVEPGSSSDEQDEEKSMSGQESRQGCKRKRASVDTETDRESDTDSRHQFTFLLFVCQSSLLASFLSHLGVVFFLKLCGLRLFPHVIHTYFTYSSADIHIFKAKGNVLGAFLTA